MMAVETVGESSNKQVDELEDRLLVRVAEMDTPEGPVSPVPALCCRTVVLGPAVPENDPATSLCCA